MNLAQRTFGHFKTITTHKIKVCQLCFRLGLYYQGLAHDLSKYSPIEFGSGVKYYQGYRSPIDAQRELAGTPYGWLNHKGRNKHHWEYWMDNTRGGLTPVVMPKRYVLEMFCDRIAASKIYLKGNYSDRSALDYFNNGAAYVAMHLSTAAYLQYLLEYLATHGEAATFKHIKETTTDLDSIDY